MIDSMDMAGAETPPLTIVGWLWRQSDCHTRYTPEHANIWARMIHRHLSIPHRFVLVTDQRKASFDPLIEPIPLWSDWRDLKRPSWSRFAPFCYARLKAFSPEFGEILRSIHHGAHGGHGEESLDSGFRRNDGNSSLSEPLTDLCDLCGENPPRFVSIDLDCVAIANLDSLFQREEDFLIIRRAPQPQKPRLGRYQGSMWMMTAGARKEIWEDFKGHDSIVAARQFIGSDQAILNHRLKKDEAGWSQADGVYSFIDLYKTHRFKEAPPANARMIFFSGPIKPWEFVAGRRHDYQWVAKHYRSDDILNRAWSI